MEVFEVILLLLAAVLVSAVLDQVLPRVALPLVQIALGVVLSVLVGVPLDIQIDTELFLVLFIAPLLFDESRHANKRDLWDNKWAIVSLAIGLVFVTMLAVGFVLHWIEPSIGLAAAFALGAALGPTDAVAVTALGKDIKLTARQKALLSGEALINDASGVVSFQFAISAAVTGAFSLLDASLSFIVSFFGGIAIGLVMGFVAKYALRAIRSRGYESVTVHVVFEVFTPFITFLLAEHFGVSGILAVVAAGLLITLFPDRRTPVAARLKLASNSVWDVIVFVVNGVVFVLLGLQLPGAVQPAVDDTHMATEWLLLLVLVVTAIVVAARFAWVYAMERHDDKQERAAVAAGERLTVDDLTIPVPDTTEDLTLTQAIHVAEAIKPVGRSKKQILRDAAIITLSGPKGAVTLSIIMTIPYTLATGGAFVRRDALIFLASGVIICTLLLANFVVPLLAPKAEGDDEGREEELNAVKLDILKKVIRELRAQRTPQNEAATQIVTRQYQERIKRLRIENTSTPTMVELRAAGYEVQRRFVVAGVKEGRIPRDEGERLFRQIESSRKLLLRAHTQRKTIGEVWGKVKVAAVQFRRNLQRWAGRVTFDEKERELHRKLRLELEKVSLDYYLGRMNDPNQEVADGAGVLVAETRQNIAFLEAEDNAERLATQNVAAQVVGEKAGGLRGALESIDSNKVQIIKARASEVEAEALRLELEEIQSHRDMGLLSREEARELREEVYALQMANG